MSKLSERVKMPSCYNVFMKSYITVLVLLLLVVGCVPVETDTNTQNVTKKLVKDENKNVSKTRNVTQRPIVPEKTCQQQVNELQNELDKKRLDLLSADSNVTKTAMLLSYLKNAYGREDDYERQKEALEVVTDTRRELQVEVRDAKSALKIMASKCGIKVKFDVD